MSNKLLKTGKHASLKQAVRGVGERIVDLNESIGDMKDLYSEIVSQQNRLVDLAHSFDERLSSLEDVVTILAGRLGIELTPGENQ